MTQKFSRFDIPALLLTPVNKCNGIKATETENSGHGSFIPPTLKDDNHNLRERIQRDPVFAQALRIEVATLFYGGEPERARRMFELLNQALRHQTARGFFTYWP